jgi:hypothetical protein
MKPKLEIYALCVCFSAVVCLVLSSGIAAYAAVMAAAPSFTLDRWVYERHVSNDAFWERREKYSEDENKKPARPPAVDLTRQRLESLELAHAVERHSGLQLLVKSVIFILGGAIALWSHWRIAGRARNSTDA